MLAYAYRVYSNSYASDNSVTGGVLTLGFSQVTKDGRKIKDCFEMNNFNSLILNLTKESFLQEFENYSKGF